MGRRKGKGKGFINVEGFVEFFKYMMEEKPFLRFLIPLVMVFWAIEKWVFSFSSWVPLVVVVWATIQYCNYQHQIVVEDLNKKWKQVTLNTSPITPLEHCEWLNKLLMEVWQSYLSPSLALRFQSMVERRLKHNKSRIVEKIELLEFSLGSCPPCLGLQGTRWSTTGDQRVMCLAFDWDTNKISIMLLAKLAKPLLGTARIVVNSLHIKGDLLLMPILDGKAILYSFVCTPEIRVGVAFGSGGSQSLPATELPGVSSFLVKLLTDTIAKTMVEPRRRCHSLPAVDLRKKAIGGIVHVKVISASKLSRISSRGSLSRRHQTSSVDGFQDLIHEKDEQTFIEVELGELTRRTAVRSGSSPQWDSTFNMVLHENTGIIHFHLYECTPNGVKYNYMASCEIKIRYAADDSTIFWAIGPGASVIARHAEFCGQEIEMVLPFEGINSGELTVRLVLKEWQFSDGSHNLNHLRISSQQSFYGSSNYPSTTGRKVNITVVEGKDLIAKEKSGKCNPYVKLQYGKGLQRTMTVHSPNPLWSQKFEFNEVAVGEYLKIKCYSEEILGDDSIGSARISLEGLVEGSTRDVWIPLEKVNSGELRLQIEAIRVNDQEGSRGSTTGSGNGLIELVLVEARDLVAADLRGTSDPYVRVHYGNLKRRTKVMFKTLNPQWNQTLEFPDDGSPLELHVKDHNSLLPTSSIGDCVVEYLMLPPNEMSDKWIPLQGVKRGEIHIQITRKVPELLKKSSLDSDPSFCKPSQISSQFKQSITKLQSLIEDGNIEGLSTALTDLEALGYEREENMVQLENEQMLLLDKIQDLGQEIFNSSPSSSRSSGS
ncbi:hypothetical protein SLE2022_296530 [Rubroshorea leprosula]